MSYIRATLESIPSASAAIFLFIICATASPSPIRSYAQEISVDEEQPRGSFVGQIRVTSLASHSDVIASHRYTIYWPTTNPSNQDLDISDSGLIRVATRLDREARSWYQFIAVCGSPPGGGVSGGACSVRVTVNVTDVNDNVPTFEESFLAANLSESAPVGVRVVSLGNAVDRDEGNNGTILYRIIGGNEDGKFR